MIKVQGLPTEEVEFTTQDGVTIKGTFMPSSRLRSPAVVLLHQLGRDRSTYMGLFEPLRFAGFSTLAIDFRGHGESTKRKSQTINWENFDKLTWLSIINDIEGAVEVLSKKRGVDPDQIGVMGASIGANVALQALASFSKIKSAVLLSPGLDYRGLESEKYADAGKDKKALIVVAKEDEYSHSSSQALSEKIGADSLIEIEGDSHGTDLFASDPSLIKKTVEYFQNTLKSNDE